MKMFLVGGAVRDLIMGQKPKDYDFSVEADSFDRMSVELESMGFKIFLSTPEFLTIRARFPADFSFAGMPMSGTTADFVMARKESGYSDGRRPDAVEPGTILDDLSRRDFTMNAIALDAGGNYIDPHKGRGAIKERTIRAVGSASDRLSEDSLRGIRAIRFAVTKDFFIDRNIDRILESPEFAASLDSISDERIREELYKAFKFDTLETLKFLNNYKNIMRKVFSIPGLWLKPTLEK